MRIRFDDVSRRVQLAGILAGCVRSGLRHPDRLPRPEDVSGLPVRARSAGGAPQLVGELVAAYTMSVERPSTVPAAAADVGDVIGGRRVQRSASGYCSVPHTYRNVRSDTRLIGAVLGRTLTGASLRTVGCLFDQLARDVDHNATQLVADDVGSLDAALVAAGSTLRISATAERDGALRVRLHHGGRTAHGLSETCRRLLEVGVVHGRLGAALGPGDDPLGVTHWETAVRISPAAQQLALAVLAPPGPDRPRLVPLAAAAGVPEQAFARALPLLDDLLDPLRRRWSERMPQAAGRADPVELRVAPDPLGAVFALSDLLAVRDRP